MQEHLTHGWHFILHSLFVVRAGLALNLIATVDVLTYLLAER